MYSQIGKFSFSNHFLSVEIHIIEKAAFIEYYLFICKQVFKSVDFNGNIFLYGIKINKGNCNLIYSHFCLNKLLLVSKVVVHFRYWVGLEM